MTNRQADGPQWDCHVHVFDGAAAVAAGHYRPVHRPLATIEKLAQDNGMSRLVLVQPSVYGSDNSALLDALRAGQGRHRGVVVLAPDVDDAALAAMHTLGLRGVRFNLVSPVGNGPGHPEQFSCAGSPPAGCGMACAVVSAPGRPAHHRGPARCQPGTRRTGPLGGHAHGTASGPCGLAGACTVGAAERLGQTVRLVPFAGCVALP